MPFIYQRKNVYYIDYRVDGKRIRKRVGKSKQIAELTLKDIEVQLAKGEISSVPKDHDLSDFLTQYMEFSKTNHSPATYERYRAIIDHFLTFLDKHPRITCNGQAQNRLFDGSRLERFTSFDLT
ncbi:MAG: hypothetical protein WCE90_07750 [Candidatus Zixiibacteriota bacterium]